MLRHIVSSLLCVLLLAGCTTTRDTEIERQDEYLSQTDVDVLVINAMTEEYPAAGELWSELILERVPQAKVEVLEGDVASNDVRRTLSLFDGELAVVVYQAHAEREEQWLRYEAEWAFDNYLAEKGYDTAEKPRINGEPGEIPGSAAYRDAWCETFLDSHSMWEDHEWERFMINHPLTQIRQLALEEIKPVIDETEKWLDSHPGADKEHVRGICMDACCDIRRA